MKQLSELAIRIFAAYLVLGSLSGGLNLVLASGVLEQGEVGRLLPVVGGLLVPIVAGILLWLVAGRIAEKWAGSAEPPPALSEPGLVSAGTFLLGVYWLLRSVGILVGQYSEQGGVNYGAGLVLLISLFLILGNRFVVRIYHRLRGA